MSRRLSENQAFLHEAYWLFHSQQSGQPRVSGRSTALVLAAAVVSELMVHRLVVVDDAGIHAADPPPDSPPDDPLLADSYRQVWAEAEAHPVVVWLEVLSVDVRDRIGQQMQDAGVAHARRSWRSLRRSVFVPTDEMQAAWPFIRVGNRVRQRVALDPRDLLLLGLAQTTPLVRELCLDTDADAREQAVGQLAGLPPPWAELLRQTRIAVDSAVLTNRA